MDVFRTITDHLINHMRKTHLDLNIQDYTTRYLDTISTIRLGPNYTDKLADYFIIQLVGTKLHFGKREVAIDDHYVLDMNAPDSIQQATLIIDKIAKHFRKLFRRKYKKSLRSEL